MIASLPRSENGGGSHQEDSRPAVMASFIAEIIVADEVPARKHGPISPGPVRHPSPDDRDGFASDQSPLASELVDDGERGRNAFGSIHHGGDHGDVMAQPQCA